MNVKKLLSGVLVLGMLMGQQTYAAEVVPGVEREPVSDTIQEQALETEAVGIERPTPERRCNGELRKGKEVEIPSDDVIAVQNDYLEYDSTNLFLTLESQVKSALLNGQTEINLERMKINRTEHDIRYLVYESPYIVGEMDLTFYSYEGTGDYAYIELYNPYTKAQTEELFYDVDKKIGQILEQVTDDMTDVEKALVIHDYFTSQYQYDYENYVNNTIPDSSYRTSGIILNEVGVCQAYAGAYRYIMELLDIPCQIVSSDTMNHAWNMIKIDNAYYHVDCTWDDPTWDCFGLAQHECFLVSDEGIRKEEHENWYIQNGGKPIVCSDTRYDTAYWRGATSPIVLYGDDAYYVKNNGLYKYTSAGAEQKLFDIGIWYVWGDKMQYYTSAFSGLFLHEGSLYYNSESQLKKYNLVTGENVAIWNPELSDEGYVYGSRLRNGQWEYALAKEPGVQERFLYYIPSETVDVRTEPQQLIFKKQKMGVEQAKSAYVQYTFAPRLSTGTVSWVSANPEIAAVDDKGRVTGVTPGQTVITGTTDNGQKASITVTVEPSMIFSDIKATHWYYDAVSYVYANRIMTGLNAQKFGPEQPLARAQFAVMLHRMNGTPEVPYTPKFPDVKDNQWYTDAILWANEYGVVTGYSNTGKFGPADYITREQMAVMMYRYAGKKGYDVGDTADFSRYVDGGKVSEFAQEAMRWAIGSGIITGKDNGRKIDPQGRANRAECGTIIMRFIEMYGN